MTKANFAATFTTMLLCSVAAMPAHAQTAAADDQTPATAQDPDDDGNVIIVTANRREESMQDVAGVVQALDADQLYVLCRRARRALRVAFNMPTIMANECTIHAEGELEVPLK